MTVVAAVAVLALAAGLYAQEEKPKADAPRMPMAWGTVVSLDKDAKTLTAKVSTKRGEEPKEMVFAITDETKVLLAGAARGETKPGTLDDVKPEKRVAVIYKAVTDAKPVALSIRIMGERTGGVRKTE